MKKGHSAGARPRLCFVGPLVGHNPGYVTTQGEILSDHFRVSGYSVISASSFTNRYIRLADIITTLVRHRRSIDILMIQVYGGRSFIVEDIASWLGQRFGHRIVMVLRNGEMPDFMRRFPSWTRRVLARAHALVAPTEFLARAIVSYGFRATIIPNVIDLSKYPYRHRLKVNPQLFWMRSFYYYYNPKMAVRVLAGLRSKIPEATLVMAGQDKGIETDVRELVKEVGLDDAVRFPGFLDMAGKIREANSADIFINTNSVDNAPVAVLEACAMGLPVVATNVGGISDLLTNGDTALFVPDNDVDQMVEAVCRLISDPSLAGKLSANGRKLAECASWQSVYPQWEEIFARVLHARNK